MNGISRHETTVFFAPTKGRRYLTARSACNAEASAKIAKKYPTEQAEYENGFCYYSGFHWSEDERCVRLHKRYMNLLLKSLKDKP